jgi:hypothetical protein
MGLRAEKISCPKDSKRNAFLSRKEKSKTVFFQPKLTVGPANDVYEREADATAEKVMRMTEPFIQRRCSHCEEDEKVLRSPLVKPIVSSSVSASGGAVSDEVVNRINATKGSGTSMDKSTQTFMEDRFGTDFSNVKIHSGDEAVKMNRALNAQAFTVGDDIYFNSGKYAPDSESGKHLLAHELTHTVQQGDIIRMTCDKNVLPDQVITDHSVDKTVIENPDEKVTFTVKFSCGPKYGGHSKISDTTSEFASKVIQPGATEFKRTWDGKKPFSSIGTFIGDGVYHNEIQGLKYSNDGATDLYASGPKLKSPEVTVRVRSAIDTATAHNHHNEANVTNLSRIIKSEMAEGNDEAKKAIAWCVRNQMFRLNTFDVIKAKETFVDAFGMAGDTETKAIADTILKLPISSDSTSGAFKWFSPKRMAVSLDDAKQKKHDCDSGVHDVVDDAGKMVKRCFPSFAGSMTKVTVPGVDEWILKIYKL